MALLVGIDEAGYGPHMGPLVVAAAAMTLPDGRIGDPDLWSDMSRYISHRPAGAGNRAVIGDSKVCYGGGGDLAVLERTVLGFLRCTGRRARNLHELLCQTRPAGSDDCAVQAEPWHRPHDMRLPAAAGDADVSHTAEMLAQGLGSVGASAAAIWIATASPARFNRLLDGGRNKADALFTLNAELLVDAIGPATPKPVHVTLDRHGGRRYYARLLMGVFPMMTLETLEESVDVSRYRMGADVFFTVRTRCETWSMATALASMAAKYVRELHMLQLNAWFRDRMPGLRPTAGYGTDARRFIDEVAAVRAAEQVPDDILWRNR